MAGEESLSPIRTERCDDPAAPIARPLDGPTSIAFSGTDFGFEWTETNTTTHPGNTVAVTTSQDRSETGPARRGGSLIRPLAALAVVGGLIIWHNGGNDAQPPRAEGLGVAPSAANCAVPSAQRRSEIEEILSTPVMSNPAESYARANNLTIKRSYTTPHIIENGLGMHNKPAFSAMLRQANADLKQFGVTLRVARPSDRLPEDMRAPSQEELASKNTAAVLNAIDNSAGLLPVEYVREGGQKTVILATGEPGVEYVYPDNTNTTIAYNLAAGPDQSMLPRVIYKVHDDAACEGAENDPGFAKLYNATGRNTAEGFLGINPEDGSIGMVHPQPFYNLNGAIDRQNTDDYCAARNVVAERNIQSVFGSGDMTSDKSAVSVLFNSNYITPYISGPDTDAPVLREKLIFLLARLPEKFGTYFAKQNARYENPDKQVLPLDCE